MQACSNRSTLIQATRSPDSHSHAAACALLRSIRHGRTRHAHLLGCAERDAASAVVRLLSGARGVQRHQQAAQHLVRRQRRALRHRVHARRAGVQRVELVPRAAKLLRPQGARTSARGLCTAMDRHGARQGEMASQTGHNPLFGSAGYCQRHFSHVFTFASVPAARNAAARPQQAAKATARQRPACRHGQSRAFGLVNR